VVVISACYSGGFIEPLRNENTLVISASAPDKNSFGCSNEAEWTYFGKAFFDEALRKTHSFVEALEIAKPLIATREKEQGHTPSDPQMALGEEIKPKLVKLQRQLSSQ
jgi:Peptidase C13 family